MLAGVLKRLRTPAPSVIEEAKDRDFTNLAEIHHQGFSKGWTDGEFAKLLTSKNYFCLVARKKGQADKPPSAFIMIRKVADEAEIITIATKKSARRKGVARQLLEAAIRKLQADRITSLFLEVDENNTAAIGLYRKLGFKKISERKGYYTSSDRDNPTTALVMQIVLG